MKTIIIKSDKDSFERIINENFIAAGVDVFSIETIVENNKKTKKLLKIFCGLRKIRSKMPGEYKVIVFEDTTLYLCACLFFRNCYLWFWNTFCPTRGNRIKLPLCQLFCKIYSFDNEDCKRYKFKYNSQFIIDFDNYEIKDETDVYFVGNDKGRYELLKKIYLYCKKNELSPLIQLFPDKDKEYISEMTSDSFIEYTNVLYNISGTKAVLDICKSGQSGTTFRVMEAIGYNKKIITNNSYYKSLFFYSPKYIYIIEDDKLAGLKDFIESDDVEYPSSVKEYYGIKKWLERFD